MLSPISTRIAEQRANVPFSDVHHKRERCRICSSSDLILFLSLGRMPLANAFLQSPTGFETEQSYPLDVYLCSACSLVQLLDVIHPSVLFSRYNYVTGTSDTIAAHNIEYARAIVTRLDMQPDDLVVEIASNDGSLLKRFVPHGVRTLGVEPATNIAEIANNAGIETVNQFFDSALALELAAAYGKARAIIGNNVLAHLDDPVDFLSGCKQLLAPDGLVSVEVPYLYDLVKQLEYDTIYHEHLSYFSVKTLMLLSRAAELEIFSVEHVPVHGGSLRVLMGHPGAHDISEANVPALLNVERVLELDRPTRYLTFSEQVIEHRRDLLHTLRTIAAKHSLAGYGAPAKGNTLLNYCGIGTDLLPYTVDKSSLKVGQFTPGMHIPVRPVSALIEDQPDYVLVLAWNFADEIVKQQQVLRDRGTKFIIPLPEPRVI
ncbi:MAG: class I SAM-dependent methyltransferase [Anaerolineae bacterium]|nr:class I SAM-dependent methyltransferase [Anaerolineae bacterium]